VAQHPIELEHAYGLQALPTAKCTKHGIVLRPDVDRPPGVLTLKYTCPACVHETEEGKAK